MALGVAVVVVVGMSGRGGGRGACVSPFLGLESVGYCLYLLLGVISGASARHAKAANVVKKTGMTNGGAERMYKSRGGE